MPADPKEFFEKYVLAPYDAWIVDELCEWKAFAVVNGLNALVDHACHHVHPYINEKQFKKELLRLRKKLKPAVDHEHIRSVAEVHKHFMITRRTNAVPETFDEKATKRQVPSLGVLALASIRPGSKLASRMTEHQQPGRPFVP